MIMCNPSDHSPDPIFPFPLPSSELTLSLFCILFCPVVYYPHIKLKKAMSIVDLIHTT
jgi:hypothetical protein